jgi:Kef-type K+ transport system membrane component KefB
MEIIASLAVILIGGLLASKVIGLLKLPSVTSFILFGILIGPHALNFTASGLLLASDTISNVVLGIVAFSIGEGFSLKFLKKFGKVVMWVSVLEVIGALVVVTLAFLFVLGEPLYLSLLFGAIATATAPAATIAIIRELKAKGTFTEVLLAVVGIDDALCLIMFSLTLVVSKAIYAHGGNLHLMSILGKAVYEILGAFVVGAVTGLVCIKVSKFFLKGEDDIVIYTLGFILIVVALSTQFHVSLLLSCMVMGTIVNNIGNLGHRLFGALRRIDTLFFLIFFVIVGANLEINQLGNTGMLVIVFVIARAIGKMGGASLGAYISETPESSIKKYLGLGLIPQAGVALGVAMIAKAEFPEVGGFILTAIIAATIIHELIGPLCSKYAIIKAGDTG